MIVATAIVRRALAVLCALIGCYMQAHASAISAVKAVQQTGVLLPLEVSVRDEGGGESPLSRYFGRTPLVLVFGYYRCPTLCTTTMEGALLAVSAARLPADAYQVIGVSIDPRETAADAGRKAALYRTAHDDVPLHLLTMGAAESAALARAAGFRYTYESRFDQYAHPLGLIVVTPEGRISRYFPGVQFEPREVRLALIEASDERIGSFSDRIFLRCAHYDPAAGRYSVPVMSFVRAGSLLIAGVLGLWMWRERKTS